MKYFIDTEFIDDGKTIDLVSIGIVTENGDTYYAESNEYDASKADDWVVENVLTKLVGNPKPNIQIGSEIIDFVEETCNHENIELYGWFSAWDFLLLIRLVSTTGKLLDTPPSWPQRCTDLAQSLQDNPFVNNMPAKPENAHNALDDAQWNKQVWSAIYLGL
jgi:hypothetical protein